MATATARTDRIALRTSKEQKSFLERGASATGQNLTEFVVECSRESRNGFGRPKPFCDFPEAVGRFCDSPR